MLTDSEIKEKYTDPDFFGAFSGGRNFQSFLKTDLNEDVPLKRIYSILKTLPFYLISQRPVRRFPRRQYSVAGFGDLIQADIAYMFDIDGWKYFLVVVDVFSRHLYVEVLKDKSSKVVQQALVKIFAQFQTPITKLETDQVKLYYYYYCCTFNANELHQIIK